MSIIDKIMAEKQDHVNYLKDLFAGMKEAGFDNIRISDEDLDPLKVDEDGAEAVIREMFQVDDAITLKADWPRHAGDTPPYDEPYRVTLLFILCNDAWESLADHTIPCESVDEALTAITDKLEERYI